MITRNEFLNKIYQEGKKKLNKELSIEKMIYASRRVSYLLSQN